MFVKHLFASKTLNKWMKKAQRTHVYQAIVHCPWHCKNHMEKLKVFPTNKVFPKEIILKYEKITRACVPIVQAVVAGRKIKPFAT